MNAAGWSADGYARIAALLLDRTGLVFSDSRKASAEALLRRAMQKAGAASADDYVARLGDARVLDDLVAQVTVGETYFFRDPGQFELLRSTILPALMALHPPSHVIKLWSAGCASGEEAYSLAILCEEMGIGDRINILATDISRPVLARAREAVYSRWSLRGVDPERVNRWFEPQSGKFVLANRVRRRVSFDYLNLAGDAYPTMLTGVRDVDVVFCRNVLIYFDDRSVERVGRRLLDALAVGGWLFTGPSDPSLPAAPPFRCQPTKGGLIYQHTEPTLGWAANVRRLAVDLPAEPVPPIDIILAATLPPHDGAAPPEDSSAAEADAPPVAEARNGTPAEVVQTAAGAADDGLANQIIALLNAGERAVAEQLAAEAAGTHPDTPCYQFIHALALIELNRYAEAADALRRALYLDSSLAMAQLALATVMWRLGEIERARTAYGAAHRLFLEHEQDDLVPLADGASAGDLASVVQAQMVLLDAAGAR